MIGKKIEIIFAVKEVWYTPDSLDFVVVAGAGKEDLVLSLDLSAEALVQAIQDTLALGSPFKGADSYICTPGTKEIIVDTISLILAILDGSSPDKEVSNAER